MLILFKRDVVKEIVIFAQLKIMNHKKTGSRIF